MPKSQKKLKAWMVAGSDEAGVKKAAQELASKLAPGADAFGLEIVDGSADSVEAALEALQQTITGLLTLPFLGGGKLVWLKSATMLADTVAGRSDAVAATVEKLCEVLEEGLPEGVQFLLSALAPDKRRSGYKKLAKFCETRVVDLPDLGFRGGEEALIEWMASKARQRGLSLEAEALEVLAARVGLDAPQLEAELDKLETAFSQGHLISAAEVRELVPQTREGGIFDLSGAILRRDLGEALETLDQLFAQGEKAVGILLAAVVPTVRNLLLVKDLMARHRIPPANFPGQFTNALNRLASPDVAHLPRKKDGTLNAYPLALASAHASNFSLEELERGFQQCAQIATRLFSGNTEDEVLLARLLAGLLARE